MQLASMSVMCMVMVLPRHIKLHHQLEIKKGYWCKP